MLPRHVPVVDLILHRNYSVLFFVKIGDMQSYYSEHVWLHYIMSLYVTLFICLTVRMSLICISSLLTPPSLSPPPSTC